MHGRKSHSSEPPAAKAGPIQKDAGWFVRGRVFEHTARAPRCHRLFRLFLANIAMHEFRNAIPVSLGQVKYGFEHKKAVFSAVHQQGSVAILQFCCREDLRTTIDNSPDYQKIPACFATVGACVHGHGPPDAPGDADKALKAAQPPPGTETKQARQGHARPYPHMGPLFRFPDDLRAFLDCRTQQHDW